MSKSRKLGVNRDLIYAPDGTTWYHLALEEAEKRGKLEAEVDRLRRDCAELYQVIGTLDELVPEMDKAVVVKALDNASAAANGDPRPHDDLLPFILESLSPPSRRGADHAV